MSSVEGYSELVSEIHDKSLMDIMDATLEETKAGFRSGKRQFIETNLPDKSEYPVGQLL